MAYFTARSTDGGAPTLNGTVGSFIAVLDYCLVTTAGWTKVYSGTNKAAYRFAVGNPLLQVLDNAALGDARQVLLRGYESMTDVDTGVNPFPNVTQHTNGLFAHKSSVLDATARGWKFFATDGFFYLVTHTLGATLTGQCYTYCFGEFIKYKPSDTHNFLLSAYTVFASNYLQGGTNGSGVPGKFVKRGVDGVTPSVAFNLLANGYIVNSEWGVPAVTPVTYPNPADGGLYISPVELYYNSSLMGRVPGLWVPRHSNIAFTVGDTFQATINGSLRTFEFVHSYQDFQLRPLIVETSNTWLI